MRSGCRPVRDAVEQDPDAVREQDGEDDLEAVDGEPRATGRLGSPGPALVVGCRMVTTAKATGVPSTIMRRRRLDCVNIAVTFEESHDDGRRLTPHRDRRMAESPR